MNYELRCRECGKSWGNQPRSVCDDCFSPLEVSYDYDAVRADEQGLRGAKPVKDVAQYLGMAPVAVEEVATFYAMYDLKPTGKKCDFNSDSTRLGKALA